MLIRYHKSEPKGSTQHYNRFHNLSNEALADAIGQTDALLKGVEAEVAQR